MPDKNLIAFLDILGRKLLPALPARAPITFKLFDGTSEAVLVPEGSQVAAKDIIFETEENMLATPAKLVEAYCVDVANDKIYRSPPNVVSGQSEIPFQTNLSYGATSKDTEKDTEIFLNKTDGLNEGDTLNISGTGRSEYAIVSNVSDNKVTLNDELKYPHDPGTDVEKVTYFELFNGKDLQEHVLYLGHDDLFKFKKGVGQNCHIYLDINFEGLTNWEIEDRKKLGLLTWEYWSENEWQPLIQKNNPDFSKELVSIKLEKTDDPPSQEREINGITSFWIRCIGSRDHTKLPPLGSISLSLDISNGPDACFYNDSPIDLKNALLLPFGETPKIYDTFYIGSQECFSKKNTEITLIFTLNQGKPVDNTILSKEYWNGASWKAIECYPNTECLPSTTTPTTLFNNPTNQPYINTLKFICPLDIQPIEVNGEKNYWLRIKILSGGFGSLEPCVFPNGCPQKIQGKTYYFMNIIPPKITNIQITINRNRNKTFDSLLTQNNVEFRNITEEAKNSNSKLFKLFNFLDDGKKTLYLGFDQKLEKGPITLFFSIDEYPWLVDDLPIIKWYYYNENDVWTIFDVLDGTQGFTRSGVVEFVLPRDFKKTTRFGKKLYWIRAVDEKDKFKSYEATIEEEFKQIIYNLTEGKPYDIDRLKRILEIHHSLIDSISENARAALNQILKEQSKSQDPITCDAEIKVFHPKWPIPDSAREKPSNPRIRGIYLNTTWGAQWESIKDEILGSSDGTAFQSFKTVRSPLISEEVWINEFKTILDGERDEIIADKEFEVEEVRDDKKNLTEFWVNWKPVENLFLISEEQYNKRFYEIDLYSGELKFGDGKHGKIPPIGRNNIKINYQTGGGSKGNLLANEIKDLNSTIAFMDKAFNPLPAEGGSDVETIDKLMERGPKILKTRDRAITTEDFEEIARETSQAIARVKCLSNFNNGRYNPGWVTILVIPHSKKDRPKLSLELKRQVEDQLYKHAPNTTNLQVSEPVYMSVSLNNANLKVLHPNLIPSVEKEAYTKLKEFLNPLTGGYEGKGWDFGRMPCISDFYNLLEKIRNVDHVKDISVTLKTDTGQEYVLTPEKKVSTQISPYSIVYNGVHRIDVETYTEEG